MAYIKTETVNHTLIITLDRLESRNAFNKAMSEEMEAIIDAYEEDKNLRCAIIRSAGPTFSAGQDLKAAMVGEFAVTEKRGGYGMMSLKKSNSPSIKKELDFLFHKEMYILYLTNKKSPQSGTFFINLFYQQFFIIMYEVLLR